MHLPIIIYPLYAQMTKFYDSQHTARVKHLILSQRISHALCKSIGTQWMYELWTLAAIRIEDIPYCTFLNELQLTPVTVTHIDDFRTDVSFILGDTMQIDKK